MKPQSAGGNGWISVIGWRRFQHYDPAKRQPPWIKSYTELLDNEEYLALSARLRGILHGIWLAYAAARCQLGASPARIGLRIGEPSVRARDLEALRDAGFIAIVASKALAEGYQDASPRVYASETDVETETKDPGGSGDPAETDTGANGVPPTEPEEAAEPAPAPAVAVVERPRDEIWDELERLFGAVVPKTNAHARRNKAVADLRKLGANADGVTRAHRAWARMFAGATVTDIALATHYPQLTRPVAVTPHTARPPEIPEPLTDEEREDNLRRIRDLATSIGGSS